MKMCRTSSAPSGNEMRCCLTCLAGGASPNPLRQKQSRDIRRRRGQVYKGCGTTPVAATHKKEA